MIRASLLLVPALLVGCTSAPSNDLLLSDAYSSRFKASPAEHTSTAEIETSRTDWSATTPETTPAVKPAFDFTLAAPLASVGSYAFEEEKSLHHSRWTIKGGLYSADADELDDGWMINVSWMRFFTKLLALELELGYLNADGDTGGIDVEAWALPLMVNGRANIPIWVLDVYGGLGLGTVYYDVDVAGVGDDDGWLLGANAFLGSTINLADAIALGLELKYYLTEDIDDADEPLDGFAVLLTLGFSR